MYTPHTDDDIASMLGVIGVTSLDELVQVPHGLAPKERIDVGPGVDELDLQRRFQALAASDAGASMTSFLGGGAYRHYIPPVVGALAMRGEFLTAYTPYQAEVSQGYLQAIYEWQTYICLLTGLDVANASVYDGATALAEAAIMAVNATGKRRILVNRAMSPQYRGVLKTYAAGIELDVTELGFTAEGTTDYTQLEAELAKGDVAACAIQSPNMFGCIDQPPAEVVTALKAAQAVPIAVIAEALSLAALRTPGDWGAEIAAGEAQSFGVPVAYGGPYVGFIACTQAHMRRIPGRLVGRTLDVHQRPAFTLTLQAREQHIRRERATSNICTNQAHCALLATIYLAALGERGLRECATHNLERSRALIAALTALPGIEQQFSAPYFNECVIRTDEDPEKLLRSLTRQGILGGIQLGKYYPELPNAILVTATEMTTDDDIAAYVRALRESHVSTRVGVGYV